MNTLWQAHYAQQVNVDKIDDFNVRPSHGTVPVSDPQLVITDLSGFTHAGIMLSFERDSPHQQNFLIGTSGNNTAIFELQALSGNAYNFLNGDLTSDTINGSQTITHKTEYVGEIELGKFCESTGEIYYMESRRSNSGEIIEWNPYEDCITKIKQSEGLNKNILGVITHISDSHCRFATHGDVLVKVINSQYALGDIIIPTTGGFGKKATEQELITCSSQCIPKLKVVSLDTKISGTVACMFC